MSLHWTLIAGMLYFEIGLCSLLMLPFISPTRWHSIFKSRALRYVEANGRILFYFTVGILVLFFGESQRQMWRYSVDVNTAVDLRNNPQALDHVHMMRFLAQRNAYITGFALFLLLVLFRLVNLITRLSVATKEQSAAMAQASSASSMAQSLLDKDSSARASEASDDTKKLKADNEKLLRDLDHARSDLQAVKDQAKNVSTEYDRLLKEHSILQAEMDRGDKKDD